MPNLMRRSGRRSVSLAVDLGLWVVLLATIVAGLQEIWSMVMARQVTLTDLLLMFIYLEVLSMVNVYWQAGKLPVRMPLYIAMVAMARYLILDAQHIDAWQLLATAMAILVLAGAVLVVRFGHLRFPYPETDEEERETRLT